MTKLPSYLEVINRINSLPVFSWEDMQPLHKNENCNNKREREAARLKQRRIKAEVPVDGDETKCLIVDKIRLLTEAINWRDAIRDTYGANVNSICFSSVMKITAISNSELKQRVIDLIVVSLRHNVHPFSLQPLQFRGLTEEIVDDIIEFCKTGSVTVKPARFVSLRADENMIIRFALQRLKVSTDEEKAMMGRIFAKLTDSGRYSGWA